MLFHHEPSFNPLPINVGPTHLNAFDLYVPKNGIEAVPRTCNEVRDWSGKRRMSRSFGGFPSME